MFKSKRFWIAMFLGLFFGVICWGFSSSEGPVEWFLALQIITSRILIGFTIGISVLKLKWWLHGIIIGAIFSIPMAFQGFFVPGKEVYIFFGSIVMGIIYGFLIELITSFVFRAKAE